MKRAKKQQLDSEQLELFDFMWRKLCEEEQKIRDDFGTARNMACSDWKYDVLIKTPTTCKMHPDSMGLLHANFNMLIEHNSRQKYFLIVAFLPIFKRLKRKLDSDKRDVYEYWEEELKKNDPELEDRFRE